MDFKKLMQISIADVAGVEQAQELYHEADEIIEKLGYTKKEYLVASNLVALRQKAVEDVSLILKTYVFSNDENEIILNDDFCSLEKLTLSNDVVTWNYDFYGITGADQAWYGKVDITVKEIFELYKAEYLYENYQDLIPRAFMAYYKRYYGVAGVFHIFVNATIVRKQ